MTRENVKRDFVWENKNRRKILIGDIIIGHCVKWSAISANKRHLYRIFFVHNHT